ncbi:MAG: tetratricopeptide repeat protein [Chitinophagaceae bacterium]|nr:tetratricopeptide repeat protein [Chitinophagaceae bacterium]
MAKRDLYTASRKTTQQSIVDNEPTSEQRLKWFENWYHSKSKLINNILIGVLAVVAGFFAYNKFFKEPKIDKSNDAIFRAQTYFGMDSLNWALNGDGANPGFLTIISKYSGTPAANLAEYYAGISYLKLGDFAKAESHLKKFDGKGTMVSLVAKGALGDASMELNKPDDAIKAYQEASSDLNNVLLSPIYIERKAIAYEMKNNKDEAIKAYKLIIDEYPSSPQAASSHKSLARLGVFN